MSEIKAESQTNAAAWCCLGTLLHVLTQTDLQMPVQMFPMSYKLPAFCKNSKAYVKSCSHPQNRFFNIMLIC